MIRRKTVVVTGCDGYIGRCLTQFLLKAGFEVFGIDSALSYRVGKVNIRNWDVTQPAFFNKINELDCNGELAGIVHLAAQSIFAPSLADPLHTYDNNVSKTVELLQFLITANIHTPFIFASSAGIYGHQNELISEDATKDPLTPYAVSKLMVEQILRDAYNAYGFISTSFRFFNVIGGVDSVDQPEPIQTQKIDQPHFLPSIFRAVIEGKPFVLNGTHLQRDYIDVRDVCYAILNEIDNPAQITNRFNISTGIATTHENFVKTVYQEMHFLGIDAPRLVIGKPREADAHYVVGNNEKYRSQRGHWHVRYHLTHSVSSELRGLMMAQRRNV